jgi:hypothetical protein
LPQFTKCVCKLQFGIQSVQINCFKIWKVNYELECDLQWRTLNEDGNREGYTTKLNQYLSFHARLCIIIRIERWTLLEGDWEPNEGVGAKALLGGSKVVFESSKFNTSKFFYRINNYQTINPIIIPYGFNHKY